MEGKIAEVKLSYQTKVKPSERIRILCSLDAYKAALNLWDQGELEHVEEFKILLLNQAKAVLGLASISKGGVSGAVVDFKVIFQYALKSNSTGIIFFHNHPSGNRKPSEGDIYLTKKAEKAASLLDIQLLDHIILAPGDRYFSFKDEGII